MSLGKVCGKSRIDFPKSLDLEQSEELLKYLAEGLEANVGYDISYHKSIIHDRKGVKTIDGAFKINGHISLLDSPGKFDTFTMDSDYSIPEVYKVRKLEFYRIPGYDFNQYREELRELWDDTREVIGKYFNAKETH